MKTEKKIEKFLTQILNEKEYHDNFIKTENIKHYYSVYFKDTIYSGQINILNNYGLKFWIQSINARELILFIYKD